MRCSAEVNTPRSACVQLLIGYQERERIERPTALKVNSVIDVCGVLIHHGGRYEICFVFFLFGIVVSITMTAPCFDPSGMDRMGDGGVFFILSCDWLLASCHFHQHPLCSRCSRMSKPAATTSAEHETSDPSHLVASFKFVQS